MTPDRLEEIAGRIVGMVFGRGYVSPGAATVFKISIAIMQNVPDEKIGEVSRGIVDMCRAIGDEAEAVVFE